MNERALACRQKQANEQTNERKSEGKKERTNVRTKERINDLSEFLPNDNTAKDFVVNM